MEKVHSVKRGYFIPLYIGAVKDAMKLILFRNLKDTLKCMKMFESLFEACIG